MVESRFSLFLSTTWNKFSRFQSKAQTSRYINSFINNIRLTSSNELFRMIREKKHNNIFVLFLELYTYKYTNTDSNDHKINTHLYGPIGSGAVLVVIILLNSLSILRYTKEKTNSSELEKNTMLDLCTSISLSD